VTADPIHDRGVKFRNAVVIADRAADKKKRGIAPLA